MTADYDRIVQFLNFKYNVLELYKNPPVPSIYVDSVRSYIHDHIRQNSVWYSRTLNNLSNTIGVTTLSCSKYVTTQQINVNYPAITQELGSIFPCIKMPKIKI